LTDIRSNCPVWGLLAGYRSTNVPNWLNFNRQLVRSQSWAKQRFLGDSQNPPIRNGIKYHVLFLNNWNECKIAVAKKRIMKITAAAKEGV
jgi:hypothetical protein